MIEKTRDLEESVDGDKGDITKPELCGGLFRHPGRDGQTTSGQPDAVRATRRLLDFDW